MKLQYYFQRTLTKNCGTCIIFPWITNTRLMKPHHNKTVESMMKSRKRKKIMEHAFYFQQTSMIFPCNPYTELIEVHHNKTIKHA